MKVSRKTALRIRIAYIALEIFLAIIMIHLLHMAAEAAFGELNPITKALDRVDIFEYIIMYDIEIR